MPIQPLVSPSLSPTSPLLSSPLLHLWSLCLESFREARQEPPRASPQKLKHDKNRWKQIMSLNSLTQIVILVLYHSYNSKRIEEHFSTDQTNRCQAESCKLMLKENESLSKSSLEIITYFGVIFALFALMGIIFESRYFMLTNSVLNLINTVSSMQEFGRTQIWVLYVMVNVWQVIGAVILVMVIYRYNIRSRYHDCSRSAINRQNVEEDGLLLSLLQTFLYKSNNDLSLNIEEPPPNYEHIILNPDKYRKPSTDLSPFYDNQSPLSTIYSASETNLIESLHNHTITSEDSLLPSYSTLNLNTIA